MTVGTKSLLFGSHQFIVHPLMVLWCWRKLYGSYPRSWKVWLAIFVHDLGYWGLPNMDGPEGDTHPQWGANLMARLFPRDPWLADLCRYHSRFVARDAGRNVSLLCAPDKLAAASWPVWLYVLLSSWSGEITEYMNRVADPTSKYNTISAPAGAPPVERETQDKYQCYREVSAYLRAWAYAHRDGQYDTWTQGENAAP